MDKLNIEYDFCKLEDFQQVYRRDHPDRELWCDFSFIDPAKSKIYGAKINGDICGAIAFNEVDYTYDEDSDEDPVAISHIIFAYVSGNCRNKGIGTHLLRYAIEYLIERQRVPIECGFSSSKFRSCFDKLPQELKNEVHLGTTDLDSGVDNTVKYGL